MEDLVSLFVVTTGTPDEFQRCLEEDFSDEGDSLGSEFTRAFGLESDEPMLQEAEFLDVPTSDLGRALARASYSDSFSKIFADDARPYLPITGFVLCYQQRPSVEPGASWRSPGGTEYRFVGSRNYRRTP